MTIPVGYLCEVWSHGKFLHRVVGQTIFEARSFKEKWADCEVFVWYIPFDIPEMSGELYGRT
jgi:hypothetical protein